MKDGLKKALAGIEQKFGKGTIMTFDESSVLDLKRFKTGSLGLDYVTGGGWPEGRIVEIYGPESSGKSTLCLHAIKEAQAVGKCCAYLDVENAFDPFYAECLGINIKDDSLFLFSQPDNGEQSFEIVENLIDSGEVALIIVDSVAALIPKAELEGDFGETKMGLQARLMSQAMRKLVSKISRSFCTVIFTNQLRDNIGVMFGPTEVTTGGNALKYYASMRLEIRRTATNKDSAGTSVSNQVRVRVTKNKTAPPFRECRFAIVFGEGISREQELIQLGVEWNVIKKSGSWFSFEDTKLGQGEENSRLTLLDNPELCDVIEKKLKEVMI